MVTQRHRGRVAARVLFRSSSEGVAERRAGDLEGQGASDSEADSAVADGMDLPGPGNRRPRHRRSPDRLSPRLQRDRGRPSHALSLGAFADLHLSCVAGGPRPWRAPPPRADTFRVPGSGWIRVVSLILGTLMLGNALGHLGASIYLGRVAPGAYSSLLLLIAALALLVTAGRARVQGA